MEKRYVALRVIATIFKIMGVLVGILTLLAMVGLVVGGVSYARQLALYGLNSVELIVVAAITTLFIGGISALSTFAAGELLYLFINIEENTRYTGILLRDRQPQ